MDTCGQGSTGSKQYKMEGYCKHGNEISSSMKYRDID